MAIRPSNSVPHNERVDTRGPQAPDVSCAYCNEEHPENTMVWAYMDEPPTPFCSPMCRAEYQRKMEEEHDTRYEDI